MTTVANLVTQSLPLLDRSFAESAKTDSYLIYNSPWCRIKFFIEKDRTQDYLHVYYGRLHAADNSWIMKWKRDNCSCWRHHADLQLILEFLDGTSPQEAYQRHLKPVPFIQDYYDSEFYKSMTSSEERTLKLHAAIWEHYGLPFFELFDLRRPELWESYIGFLKAYYTLSYEETRTVHEKRGMTWNPSEPLGYKVC
jgi:hypothetical protein